MEVEELIRFKQLISKRRHRTATPEELQELSSLKLKGKALGAVKFALMLSTVRNRDQKT